MTDLATYVSRDGAITYTGQDGSPDHLDGDVGTKLGWTATEV